MPSRGSTARVAASARWRDVDLLAMLSRSAITLGAGTPTDAGTSWAPPTEASNPIGLGAGMPDPATMPVRELQEALTHVLCCTPEAALEYGGVLGLDGLRESLAERGSRRDGVPLSPRNFIMTAGSSGGIDNVCSAFVEPGAVIMVESPSFFGSVRTIRGHMAEVVPVTMDEEGVSVDELAEHIREAEAVGKKVKLLYTVADFHNPTGTTMSPDRRYALIELCAERHVLIVEDAAYADIYFEAEPPLSLYGLAEGEGVIKVGTFSKPIATGLRVGWVQAREDIIDALSRVRFDMGISPLLLGHWPITSARVVSTGISSG